MVQVVTLVVVCNISVLSIVAASTASGTSTPAAVELLVIPLVGILVGAGLPGLHELIAVQTNITVAIVNWQGIEAHGSIDNDAIISRGLGLGHCGRCCRPGCEDKELEACPSSGIVIGLKYCQLHSRSYRPSSKCSGRHTHCSWNCPIRSASSLVSQRISAMTFGFDWRMRQLCTEIPVLRRASSTSAAVVPGAKPRTSTRCGPARPLMVRPPVGGACCRAPALAAAPANCAPPPRAIPLPLIFLVGTMFTCA